MILSKPFVQKQSLLWFRKIRIKTPSLKTYILPRLYQYFLPLLGTLNFLPAWVLQRAREPPNPGRTLLLVERSNLELEPKPNCFQSETNCEKETYYSSNILRRLHFFFKWPVISTHYFFYSTKIWQPVLFVKLLQKQFDIQISCQIYSLK